MHARSFPCGLATRPPSPGSTVGECTALQLDLNRFVYIANTLPGGSVAPACGMSSALPECAAANGKSDAPEKATEQQDHAKLTSSACSLSGQWTGGRCIIQWTVSRCIIQWTVSLIASISLLHATPRPPMHVWHPHSWACPHLTLHALPCSRR